LISIFSQCVDALITGARLSATRIEAIYLSQYIGMGGGTIKAD